MLLFLGIVMPTVLYIPPPNACGESNRWTASS